MNTLHLLTKPILTSVGVCGALVVGGSSLAIGIKSNNNQNVETNKDYEDIEEEKNQPPAPTIQIMPEYQSGMLFEVNDPLANEAKAFKCHIENQTDLEDCSLFKIAEKEGNKNLWIGIGDFKGLPKTEDIESKFASDAEAIYRVNVKEAFINKWLENTENKLKVFAVGVDHLTTKPLTTISVKGVINKKDSYRGPLQYIFAQAQPITAGSGEDALTIDITNKTFKCDFPDTEETFEDCEILYFFEEETVEGPNKNKKIKTTLTKTNNLVKKLHYLIRFIQPLNWKKAIYEPECKDILINVFVDEQRNQPETTGVTSMTFTYKFATTIFGKDNRVDFATVT